MTVSSCDRGEYLARLIEHLHGSTRSRIHYERFA